MKSSNLAERLEELEAVMETLGDEPSIRVLAERDAATANGGELPRRPRRARIEIRDQGLRPFRVC